MHNSIDVFYKQNRIDVLPMTGGWTEIQSDSMIGYVYILQSKYLFVMAII